MLDTRQIPDMQDLAIRCMNLCDVSEMLEDYACNLFAPQDDAERVKQERLVSAVTVLTDFIREISALVNVISGYDSPEKYGFPAPISPQQSTGKEEILFSNEDRAMPGAAAPKAGDSQ